MKRLLARIDVTVDEETGLWEQDGNIYPPLETKDEQIIAVAMVVMVAAELLKLRWGMSRSEVADLFAKAQKMKEADVPVTARWRTDETKP